MNNLLIVLIKALQLMLSLSLLVFIHELGHFLIARLFKVRVERFFLFFDMGRPLLQYQSKRSGTIYGLGWLPLGGYCSMAGMVDERFLMGYDPTAPQKGDFRAKPAWQRLLIMIGGILFNLILAVFIYTGVVYTWGDQCLWSDQVSAGMSFSPEAQEIGFRDNDIILSVDGIRQNALSNAFFRAVLEGKEVEVLRQGERKTISIPSDMMQRVLKSKVGLMGIQIPFVVDSVLPNTAALRANLQKGDQLIQIDTIGISDVLDAMLYLQANPKEEHRLTLLRNGERVEEMIQTDSLGRMGVQLTPLNEVYPMEQLSYSFFESFPRGIEKAYATLANYVSDMQYVFTKEGASQMGGFVSIGKLFPKAFDAYSFWSITALLSLILAFMNFLPIPMLDGGYIFFTIWEIITGKRVSDKSLLKANKVGLVILLILLIYANGNDLIRLFL